MNPRFNGMKRSAGCWGFDESSAVVKMLTEIAPRLIPYRRIPASFASFANIFLDRHVLCSLAGIWYGPVNNLGRERIAIANGNPGSARQ